MSQRGIFKVQLFRQQCDDIRAVGRVPDSTYGQQDKPHIQAGGLNQLCIICNFHYRKKVQMFMEKLETEEIIFSFRNLIKASHHHLSNLKK